MRCRKIRHQATKDARRRAWRWSWLALLLCFAAAPAARAQIDTAINQTVWKMLYGVSDAQLADPTWAAADDDGDGIPNGMELAAGTNPFDATSAFAATPTPTGDGTLTLNFSTVPGKQYFLQSSTDITNPTTWTPVASVSPATGTGAPQTLVTPLADVGNAASMYYRVAVQDLDTDGDGVSDWAEKVTGFDPTNTHTHGAAQDDHTALAADLAQENVITVSATEATATQPPNAATAATDTATLTITRGGTLHFSTITVPINWTGTAVAGVDYASLPSVVTFPPKVGSVTFTVIPLANPARQTPGTVTLAARPGGGYALGAASSASAVITPSGQAVGTGLTGTYFNGTKSTVTPYNPSVLFGGTPLVTRLDATVDFLWTVTTTVGTTTTSVAGSPSPGVINTNYFGARWQGQVQPQYSETYYFDVTADDGVKLWVNGQLIIDTWSYLGTGDRLGSIALQAGVLYDIKLEYYQYTGGDLVHLFWYSNSQVKQIIPTARLYPLSSTPAPPAITSAPQAVGFVNQPFAFNVTASTSGGAAATFALGNASGPLPPGLSLNPATGLISGTPTTAGDWQVALTATNAVGVGASVLDIQILNPGNGVTRELWQNLAGSNVSDLPLTGTPDSIDNTLVTPEDNNAYNNNTGERLRGYFVAPTTGNYYFWLAASNVAELWVSDTAQPSSLVRRAWVAAPGTAVESWNDAGQTRQRSPWLSLVAGQKYYYEVLHNTGAAAPAATGNSAAVSKKQTANGANSAKSKTSGVLKPADTGTGTGTNNLAVGFLLDPTGLVANPAAGTGGGVVPGYILSQYDYPTTAAAAGTLYGSSLSPQGTAVSAATGSANLRLLPGNAQAILHFNYGGLSSPRTAYHIHLAPDTTGSGPIVFDLDDVDKFHPELKTADGGYIWNITDSGAYTAAQIVTAIQGGRTYFNVHTVNYPGGEIRGFLTLINGSQNPPTPVPDPGFSDDSASDAGAARFLNQAAYGAAPADMAAVQGGGYAAWITAQMALPATHLLPDVNAQAASIAVNPLGSTTMQNAWWRAAVTAPDQLRQRVAFALSEILVVSDSNSTLAQRADGLASFNDTLADNAFGNFRALLKAVTLHPTMGYWLNMQGNARGSLTTGMHANENYAREVLQLFSVGLNRLWPDGSLVLDTTGNPVPTYSQDAITNGFARVFTGWTWYQPLQASGQLPTNFYPTTADFVDPMVMVKNYHELGSKNLLDNVVLPPAVGYSLTASAVSGSQADTTTAAYDAFCLNDLEQALDDIFYHPNVGPYICRQLIQRLVESNPSPGYLGRVVQKFNDDGTSAHVRGNLAAVVQTILLDGEARDPVAASASTSAGKQREPLLRITGPARTFLSTANSGTYSQANSSILTITTVNPHHFSAGDIVGLDFSGNDTGTPPVAPWNNPSSGSFTVLATPAPTTNTFSVSALSVTAATWSQPAGSNTLTVATNGPVAGDQVFLKFLTGGGTDGIYPVLAAGSDGHSFTVTTPGIAPVAALSGTLIVPKSSCYYYITAGSGSAPATILVAATSNCNVNAGDSVWIHPGAASQLTAGAFVVASVIDERHFTLVNGTVYKSETSNGSYLFDLVTPPLTRSGVVNLPASKFDMVNTNAQLGQTPMDSPTVFNFFYPNYEYPGNLSANGITTPEFELTTDSSIVTLTNTIASTILISNNTYGLSNFKSGAINLDLSAYMVPPYILSVNTVTTVNGTKITAVTTTTFDANRLVNKLGDVLTGGMMTPDAKNAIVSFLTNTTAFPTTVTNIGYTTTTPPVAATTARDIVRAAVQAILVSPEYAVQR